VSAAEKKGGEVRLQKIIAGAGIASRRKSEELITQGRVQVNGKVVTELGAKADPSKDHIRVDGKLLHGAERTRYFVLNKPRGYVTTLKDPEHRPTVAQIFSHVRERLFPVGRLDYGSEGLLLMTNDGELANSLMRAANGVEKVYVVKVAGRPSEEALERLRQGVRIPKGRVSAEEEEKGSGSSAAKPTETVLTAPAGIRVVKDAENPWLEVRLVEGRNRQIRKMFEEAGHHVEKIRRIAYGPLELDVPPGEFRELDESEVEALKKAARAASRTKPGAGAAKRLGVQPKESARRGKPGKRSQKLSPKAAARAAFSGAKQNSRKASRKGQVAHPSGRGKASNSKRQPQGHRKQES
jgi:23S rRNA pseudouridine2605 synthase